MVPSKLSMEVEVVPLRQTEYPPVLKSVEPTIYQSSYLGHVLYPEAQQ